MIKVKNRLRKAKHPIKLFGETNYQTYMRLCKIEENDTSDIMSKKDQTKFKNKERHTNLNDFQRSIKDKLKDK